MERDEHDLWLAKLAEKREKRNRYISNFLATYKPVGQAIPVYIAQLFEFGAENLGEIHTMWREIVKSSWAERVVAPISAAKSQKEEIEKIHSDEINLIENEIKDHLAKANPALRGLDISKELEPFKLSAEVQKNSSLVLVEHLRCSKERTITDKVSEKSERAADRRNNRTGFILGAVAGILGGLTAAWTTDRLNNQHLDPQIEISLGQPAHNGVIAVSSDTVNFLINNIGPNAISNVNVHLDFFFSDVNFQSITPGLLVLPPLFTIDHLGSGNERIMPFGHDDRLHWSGTFDNQNFKGKMTYAHLRVTYRRESDGREYQKSRLYLVSKTNIVPWDFPLSREAMLSDDYR